MRLTLLELLEATGGGEIGGTQVGNTFATYHTDSREVVSGGVFFALRGGRMDGHRFIPDALGRGAAALVVERRTEIAHGVVEIIVRNTWDALFAVASYVRERVNPLVIGVTGSNGKTSTKEMVAVILERKYAVLRTTGNLNTETGAPMTSFGLGAGDFRGEHYAATSGGGCQFTVRDVEVHLALQGRHQARNALAALAVAEFAGLSIDEGAQALTDVAVPHRLQEHETSNGVVIIDDAYNASPESMLAAFETLAERPKKGRLLAVLGAKGELGSLAVESHRRVGRRAAEVFDAVAVLDSEWGRVLAEASDAHLVPDKESAVMWVQNN